MKKNILHKIKVFRLTLFSKMVLLICALTILMLILLGIYLNTKYSNTIEEQIGIRALNLAQAVAEIPEIREAFELEEPSSVIQPIVEKIRISTESEFIVIGNYEGIRYSHPLTERIGQKMVGDDNERALLQGESYISKAVGSLGPSIRGKVPIFSMNGDIIGVVSVGFLTKDIELTIGEYVEDVWIWLFVCIVVGVIGAFLISFHVKKSILGLEPEEIGQLYQERESILESMHEGMIAVDRHGYITMFNHAARKLLATESEVLGRPIRDVLPQSRLMEVLETRQGQYNQDFWLKEERFVVNRVPIFYENRIIGAVSTFRNITEIEKLAEELSKVKQYSEALRVQTHEFSNKLNTISGLLQLGRVPEAIDFINIESKKQQEWIHFLINSVADPYISAVLLGKLNRAHELGILMSIDNNSQLISPLSIKQREAFVTILGNLLENAYDAVLVNGRKKKIHISFTDIGNDIIFEIEDNGNGIPDEQIDNIFTKGYTTKKGEHRGIGLALVQQLLLDLSGTLFIEQSELGGACFIVAVPKADSLKGDING